jgi:hypothetical protein
MKGTLPHPTKKTKRILVHVPLETSNKFVVRGGAGPKATRVMALDVMALDVGRKSLTPPSPS